MKHVDIFFNPECNTWVMDSEEIRGCPLGEPMATDVDTLLAKAADKILTTYSEYRGDIGFRILHHGSPARSKVVFTDLRVTQQRLGGNRRYPLPGLPQQWTVNITDKNGVDITHKFNLLIPSPVSIIPEVHILTDQPNVFVLGETTEVEVRVKQGAAVRGGLLTLAFTPKHLIK